jgi:hypothetical protein
MAPRIAPPATTTPAARTSTAQARRTVKAVKVVQAKKPKLFAAKVRGVDDQFSATLEFSPAYGSDAGRTYGPLSLTPGAGSPEGDKEFYVRCRLEQHRVEPLLQGFRTYWDPPPGWVAMDGLTATIYDEAISNPLYINRVYKTPATISNEIGFLVVVKAKYRP